MKYIYIVCQTQTEADLKDFPIYAMSNRWYAQSYARILNEKYAEGVKLDDNFDFEYVGNEERHHYYHVIRMEINERMK